MSLLGITVEIYPTIITELTVSVDCQLSSGTCGASIIITLACHPTMCSVYIVGSQSGVHWPRISSKSCTPLSQHCEKLNAQGQHRQVIFDAESCSCARQVHTCIYILKWSSRRLLKISAEKPDFALTVVFSSVRDENPKTMIQNYPRKKQFVGISWNKLLFSAAFPSSFIFMQGALLSNLLDRFRGGCSRSRSD